MNRILVEPAAGLTAPVVDLKRNSLDDGPGIRTVVFFKGCPLDCVWCQNPETKSPARQLVYEPADCVGCCRCGEVCTNALDTYASAAAAGVTTRGGTSIMTDGSPYGAVTAAKDPAIRITPDRRYPVDASRCILCGACVEVCPAGALRFAETDFTVDELLRKLLVDEVFYRNTGGGVTLSGGEPTLRMRFAAELARRLRERGIHVCLETCGMYDGDEFRRVLLPFLDLIYFDVKLFDSARHQEYCGLPNDVILDNLRFLLDEAREMVVPRIPLIPGITTDPGNLSAIRDFLKERGVNRIGLIPYNPLWLSKSREIGMEPAYDRTEWLSVEEKREIMEMFEGFEFRRM